jgi:O-antigen/teichoic acid export membrane protein
MPALERANRVDQQLVPSNECEVIACDRQASLWHHTAVKRYVLLNIGHLVSRAALVITTVYLGRMLGVRSFGIVMYFQAAAILLAMGTDCGLAWQASHELARIYGERGYKDELLRSFNRVSSLRLALASLLCAGWWAATYSSEFLAAHRPLLLAFGLSFFISAIAPEWVLIAVGHTRALVVGRVIRSLAFLGLIVALVGTSLEETWVGVAYTLAFAISAGYLLLHLRRHWGWTPQLSMERKPLQTLLRAIPFFAFTGLGQLFLLIGLLASRWFVGPEDVGLYAAAFRLAVTFVPLSFFVVTALMPEIGASSIAALPATVGFLMICCAALGLPLVVVGALESKTLLQAVLGTAYAPAGPLFGILLYGLPLQGVALLAAAALNQMGRARRVMTVITISALLQVPMAAVATKMLGPVGVAVATDVGILICASALCAMLKGLLKESGLTLIGLLLGAAAMHIGLYAMVTRISWCSSLAARLALEGCVATGYVLLLKRFGIDPRALLQSHLKSPLSVTFTRY